LAQLQADADLKHAGYREEAVRQATAMLGQAKVAMENAERTYARQSALVKSNGVSRQNFENARAAYHEAEQQMKAAEANLQQLEAGFREEEIAASDAALAAARAGTGVAEATVLKAEAAVEAAK